MGFWGFGEQYVTEPNYDCLKPQKPLKNVKVIFNKKSHENF